MNIPQLVKDTVDYREQQKCARCGHVIWSNGSRHHRLLRSRGRDDSVENLLLMCGSGTTGCHGWVHREVDKATRLGFIVPSHEAPAEWPVQHFLLGWCLLLPAGLWAPISVAEATAYITDSLGAAA